MKFDLKTHFDSNEPIVLEIFERILRDLEPLGTFKIEPHQTSIHLVRKTAFVGIATRKSYLLLTIKDDRPARGLRIHKSERTSSHRYHQIVKISSTKEIDTELLGWIRHAWDLSF